MIHIKASISNGENTHQITLTTNDHPHKIAIESKEGGFGSKANGGEMLFLALATCYCNDIYREAAKRNIAVKGIEIEVEGEFQAIAGAIAENVVYRVKVDSNASEEELMALMKHTDTVAEIQNTLRQGISVVLEAVSVAKSD